MSIDWKRKLTSRKFWAAVVNFITQLMLVLKMSENEVAQVAAVIMAGAGVIAYIVGEGMAARTRARRSRPRPSSWRRQP